MDRRTRKPLDQWFLNLSMNQSQLEDVFKYRLLGPTLRFSDSGGLGWGLRICISKKFPTGSNSAGSGTIFGE